VSIGRQLAFLFPFFLQFSRCFSPGTGHVFLFQPQAKNAGLPFSSVLVFFSVFSPPSTDKHGSVLSFFLHPDFLSICFTTIPTSTRYITSTPPSPFSFEKFCSLPLCGASLSFGTFLLAEAVFFLFFLPFGPFL